ncbi:Uncharacterized protein BM_BM13481 [Brugia malayi]|uniref:Bm13481 n=1 Tax=Brugia malayi TaxID=6279 RepID=A0A0K0IXY7_BRUMA|nr:Uncharacterized protein BM_BM13481 [Brugia malayi]CDP96835.1 Bm13481 [Brugia malayi]VIO94221.1 Uncharacterized protein BM_BM13481 [Brugia malayi]
MILCNLYQYFHPALSNTEDIAEENDFIRGSHAIKS